MRSSCIVIQGLPLPLFSSFFIMINTSNIISFFLIFQIAFECILLQNDVISHYFLLNWKNRHTHGKMIFLGRQSNVFLVLKSAAKGILSVRQYYLLSLCAELYLLCILIFCEQVFFGGAWACTGTSHSNLHVILNNNSIQEILYDMCGWSFGM